MNLKHCVPMKIWTYKSVKAWIVKYEEDGEVDYEVHFSLMDASDHAGQASAIMPLPEIIEAKVLIKDGFSWPDREEYGEHRGKTRKDPNVVDFIEQIEAEQEKERKLYEELDDADDEEQTY